MKYVLLLLFLAGCSTTIYEEGESIVYTCPGCSEAYNGFETCAFYDVDGEWSREEMLVDHENYAGTGTPIEVSGYMHHKFCFNETHAVMGSANPTTTGLTKNNNLVVLFESSTMAHNFAAEYGYLQGQHPGFHTTTWFYNNKTIHHYFCPRDDCEEKVISALSEAEESILFLTFSFTSDAVGALLQEKHSLGVEVKGIVEPWGANNVGGEYKKLFAEGIIVEKINTPGIMHHKAFVIDGETAIIGSYNPTKRATTKNAESIVITQEPTVIQAIISEYETIKNTQHS